MCFGLGWVNVVLLRIMICVVKIVISVVLLFLMSVDGLRNEMMDWLDGILLVSVINCVFFCRLVIVIVVKLLVKILRFVVLMLIVSVLVKR